MCPVAVGPSTVLLSSLGDRLNTVFAELKQLEVHPAPENLIVVDLSWYELLLHALLFY